MFQNRVKTKTPCTISSVVSIFLVLAGCATGFQSPFLFAAQDVSPARTGETAGLRIVVVSGNAGINVVKTGAATLPVVEVRDRQNMPVAGAIVTFVSPSSGPGVDFANGTHTLSLITETNGRAALTEMTPSGVGAFQIEVTVNYNDAFATATIKQTNYATLADAKQAGAALSNMAASGTEAKERRLSNGAITAVVLGVAGAAALGIVLGLRHTGGSSSSSKIGVGNPTVGAP